MRLSEILNEQADATVTPALLGGLSYLVPGEWDSTVQLEGLVRKYGGETELDKIAGYATHANLFFERDGNNHRHAMRIFSGVDTFDQVAAGAALASKVGGLFNLGALFEKFTPASDTAQAGDAAVKLLAEIAAFTLLQGAPSLSVSSVKEFVSALGDYASEDRMRIASWVVIDGLLPLGPDFMSILGDKLSGATGSVTSSPAWGAVKELLPGASDEDKAGFASEAIESAKHWVDGFVSTNELTQDGVLASLSKGMNLADSSFDYVAATLDLTTNFFEYTGAQTVARYVIRDSREEWLEIERGVDAARAARDQQAMAPERRKSTERIAKSRVRDEKIKGGRRKQLSPAETAGREPRRPGNRRPVDRVLAQVVAAAMMCDDTVTREEVKTGLDMLAAHELFARMDRDEVKTALKAAVDVVDDIGVRGVLQRARSLRGTASAEEAIILVGTVQDIDGEATRGEERFLGKLCRRVDVSEERAMDLLMGVEG